MNKLITAIPLSNITKIQIYVNTDKKTVAQIKAETGAAYILNGGLYNPNWTPCCHLRVDGHVLASDSYTYYGYAWSNTDISMTTVPAPTKPNYICCTALIDKYGAVAKPMYVPAQGGIRGRSAFGLKGDQLCLYCSKDGTNQAKTPEALRDELLALGWTTGIMLDSGGSSQCAFLDQTIKSSRVVHNLILIYTKDSPCPYAEPTRVIRKGNTGIAVKWLQWHLNKHNYDCGAVDGLFGGKTHLALLAFQTQKGLTTDGICGPLTRAALRRLYD